MACGSVHSEVYVWILCGAMVHLSIATKLNREQPLFTWLCLILARSLWKENIVRVYWFLFSSAVDRQDMQFISSVE